MRKINKIHKWQMIVMIILLSLLMGSCNDDNSPNEMDDDNSAVIYEKLKTQSLIANLCKIETLEGGGMRYSSRWGKQLYQIMPSTYYIGVDSLAEAENTYFSIISVLQDDIDKPIKDYDIQQGDCQLSFKIGNQSDEIARIDIECPVLKDCLTSIVFIPLELWPENDAASPFKYLSLWRNKDGHYYLCVREAKGDKGIMITFDGGYGEDSFKKYKYWQGEFSLYTNTASATAFECLCRALKYNRDQYNKMLQKLALQNEQKGKGAVFSTLYNTEEWLTFDRYYTYDYGLWWAHYCYYVRVERTKFNKDANWIHFNDYYEHKKTPTKQRPSHSFEFEPTYNKSGWEPIYVGG